MNRFFCRHLIILFLLPILFWGLADAAAVDAARLYEESLKKLEERLQRASPDDFTFVVMGDSRDNDAIFKKNLKLIKTLNPLFVLHGGDGVRHGCKEEINQFLDVVRKNSPDIPFFFVIGNHEICGKEKHTGGGKKYFEDHVAPLNYAIDLKRLNVRVVLLDNTSYALNPSQLVYLRNQLTSERRYQFVAMHIPPTTNRWSFHTFSRGAPELIKILAENKVQTAFFSHLHFYDQDVVQGVKYIITGGGGAPLIPMGVGSPVYHIVVVTVKNGQVTTRMVEVGN
jgi:predicted phosphodiesterase